MKSSFSGGFVSPIFLPFISSHRTVSPSSKFGLQFTSEGSDTVKRLKDAFRSTKPGSQVLTGGPDIRYIRSAHSGIFSLSRFQRVTSPQGSQQPEGELQAADVAAQIDQQEAPIRSSQSEQMAQQSAQTATQRERKDAILQKVGGDFAVWSNEERAAPAPGRKSNDAMRHSVFRRAEVTKAVRDGIAELRMMEAETERAAKQEHGGSALVEELAGARQQLLLRALHISYPGLVLDLKNTDRAPTANEMDGLGRALRDLDDLLNQAGGGGQDTLLMIEIMGRMGRNGEFLNSPIGSQRAAGIAGMTAITETILDAVRPPNDGVALNSLMGLSTQLDGVLMAVRKQAIERVLTAACTIEKQLPVSALSDADRASIATTAQTIVQQDAEFARARQQLRVALQRANIPFTMNGLGGVRVDAGLVVALRRKLGNKAEEVGVIIAALISLERNACESQESRRLLTAVDRLLTEARLRLDEVEVPRAKALGELQHSLANGKATLKELSRLGEEYHMTQLEGRIQALESQIKDMERPEPVLKGLRDDVRALVRRRDSLLGEGELAAERYREASKASQELRQREASEPEHLPLQQNQGALPGGRSEAAKRATAYWNSRRDDLQIALGDTQLEIDFARGQLDRYRNQGSGSANGPRDDKGSPELHWATQNLKRAEEKLTEQDAAVEKSRSYLDAVQTGGLSKEELKKLGLTDAESSTALSTIIQLARQGVSSAAQAAEVVSSINKHFDRIGGREYHTDQALTGSFEKSGTNEYRAKKFGDILAQNLTGTTEKLEGETMIAALHEKLVGLLPGADQPAGPLDASLQRYAEFERRMVDIAARQNRLQADQIHNEEVLKAFNLNKKKQLDLAHPAGLTPSKLIIEAQGLLGEATRFEDLPPKKRARLQEIRKQLRGFDRNEMSLPRLQIGRPMLDEAAFIALVKDQQVEQVARSICFIREVALERRRALELEANGILLGMDEIAADRTDLLTEGGIALRDTIRLAILTRFAEVNAKEGATIATFCPADHAAQINQWLADVGVDVNRFRPEINAILSESFGPDELNLWVESTSKTPAYEAAIKRNAETEGEALQGKDRRGGLKTETKVKLLNYLDHLSVGGSVELTANHAVEVRSPVLPISGGITGDVRVTGGAMSMLKISRAPNGYEVLVRNGFKGGFGARARVEPLMLGKVGLTLMVRAGFTASGWSLSGVSLRFPGDEAGLEDLKAVMETILTEKAIEPTDLAQVQEITPIVESSGRFDTNIIGRVSFDPFQSDTEWHEHVDGEYDRYVHARVRMSAEVTAGGSNYTANLANTNGILIKREKDFAIGLSATASLLNGKYGANLNESARQDISEPEAPGTDVIAFGAKTSLYIKLRRAEARGVDGLLEKGTQISREMYVPLGVGQAAIRFMGGGALQDALKKTMDKRILEDVRALITMAGENDKVRIVFTLDERIRAHANTLLTEARALREGRMPAKDAKDVEVRAKEIERTVENLLDDNNNYNASKFMLMPTQASREQLSLINLAVVHWVTYTDANVEQVALEVSLDQELAEQVNAKRTFARASAAKLATTEVQA
ncbi:hypothetical protein [Hyphomicrobium sp. MC1]|uniref:hypothetical protein n=1 Tax=Hyphomicrobium sp. (strain MC1) TaxID=717785 RepID=UPI000213ED95|nr:hypothetical protein [Hyphomicrobium sp. MC1]CCB66645.1 protein of unknown function [Hyphomicrobium sp. MC1]